jgi:molybdopterin molybdotransferase
MFSPTEAEAAIVTHAPRLPAMPLALRDVAGSVLRQEVRAERDQPPFDRVSMDGIAISSAGTTREFRVTGTQAAGAPPLTLRDKTECIEVMTGAMLPHGCDCVIPVERISTDRGLVRLADDVVPAPSLNVHRRGIDCQAGTEVLKTGTLLGPPEVAVLASAGLVHVLVTRMPRIVAVSTGDELVEPGKPIDAWQIRRSNIYGVLAALRRSGFTRCSDDHLEDDEELLRNRLRKHLDESDVVILSGGVSMGKFDFVPRVLAELGVREIFHKIAQRPGKPMWFGVRDDGKAVYALPGNPVSTLVCLARYVVPGLHAAIGWNTGAAKKVQLIEGWRTMANLWTLLPVKLDGNGIAAEPRPTRGSGDFTSLLGTDGFVELPPGSDGVESGTLVPFYSW